MKNDCDRDACRWSRQRRGVDPAVGKAADFYADPYCQDIFQNWLATITSRVNTLTGVAYRCATKNALCSAPVRPAIKNALCSAPHAA